MRNSSVSEETAFKKAVFDLIKELEAESRANPDSTDSSDLHTIRKVVSMLYETFFSDSSSGKTVKDRLFSSSDSSSDKAVKDRLFSSSDSSSGKAVKDKLLSRSDSSSNRIDKEKHYSRNLNMPVENLPGTPEEAEKWGWDDSVAADCHQFTSPDKSNIKFVSPDERSEAIFTSEGILVTAPEDYGTYNFAAPNEDPVGHFNLDVLPWLIWGNEEADSTTMSMRLRAFVVDGGKHVVESHIKSEEPKQASSYSEQIMAQPEQSGAGQRQQLAQPEQSGAGQRQQLAQPELAGGESGKQLTRQERIACEKLYYAIGRGQEDEVMRLLSHGAQINALRSENPVLKMVDFENIYPIEKACKTSFEMASLLLDEGARADVVDPHEMSTPLIFALSENYEKRFELAFRLIGCGVDIEQVDSNRRTALNRAAVIFPADGEGARATELELMKYLLEHCDIESVIKRSGTNPLVEAARFDNIPVMEYILDNNLIDINRTSAGFTPLMKAVLANCETAVRLLIERGADTTILSPGAKTAADYAVMRGNEPIKALL